MKFALRTLLIVALAALPFSAVAGDLEKNLGDDFSKDFESSFQMGGWFADTDGNQSQVSEFEPNDGSPALGFLADSHSDWGSLSIGYDYNHKDDSNGHLDFDLGRMVRSHTSYNKFIHRFGHDNMSNLEATSTNGKVVWHTDLDPNQEYGINYQLLQHRTEFQFDALSALTLAVEYRDQRRNGHKQAYTTSHCDNCHIYSQDHKVDERTRDAKLEATVGWKGGSLVGSWNHRTLSNSPQYVTQQFDNALHPELQVPVFNNRLQYDDEVGAVPADFTPNQEKSTGRLDVNINSLGGWAINIGGVYQDSKNQYTGYRAEYKGLMLNAAKAIGKKTRLRWRVRSYSMDNDEVWVDVNDRVSIAGPHAGQTYEDWTGQNFDHTRYSVMDRAVIKSKLDLSYRISKTAGTLRFAWDYSNKDRDYYEVLPHETETTENLFGVYWRSRPAKNFKLQAHFKHAEVSNPFMLVDGACSTLVSGSNSNPWDPDATAQYYEFHDARIAETTAAPASWDEAKLGLTWTIGSKTTLTGSYKVWNGDNGKGDLTDWSRTNQNGVLTLWSGPTESFSWYIGYAMTDSQLDAPVCIPIFDG